MRYCTPRDLDATCHIMNQWIIDIIWYNVTLTFNYDFTRIKFTRSKIQDCHQWIGSSTSFSRTDTSDIQFKCTYLPAQYNNIIIVLISQLIMQYMGHNNSTWFRKTSGVVHGIGRAPDMAYGIMVQLLSIIVWQFSKTLIPLKTTVRPFFINEVAGWFLSEEMNG